MSRWVSPFIFLYGIYLVLYGHLSPGGGFPGGVVLASSFILALLAEGRKAALNKLPYYIAKRLDASGAFFFLLIAILGLAVSGVFFINFIQQIRPGMEMRLVNAGTVVLSNFAIGIKICASVFLIILFLSALRIEKDKEIKTIEEE